MINVSIMLSIFLTITTNKCNVSDEIKLVQANHIQIDNFQKILDEAKLDGSILIYDLQKKHILFQ